MSTNERILSPFTLPNGTELKNRLLMAPMTTCTGYYDGTVTSELVEYYRARAGSIGTIIVECCFVDDLGLAFPGAIGIDNDEKIAGLAKIADAIKSKGSKALLQIYHGGRMVDPKLIGGRTPVGPSAVAAPRDGAATPVALTAEEVEGMIGKFGEAVRRAIQAGFDGVEIHGANTYLIQQFFSPNSNQRDDEWGGSREKRMRFPLAVVDAVNAVKAKHGKNEFIVGYRFSPEEAGSNGLTMEDCLVLVDALCGKPLQYLHISLHEFGKKARRGADTSKTRMELVHEKINGRLPLIGVGSLLSGEQVAAAFESGWTEFVAMGKLSMINPNIGTLLREGNDAAIVSQLDPEKADRYGIPDLLWSLCQQGGAWLPPLKGSTDWKPMDI